MAKLGLKYMAWAPIDTEGDAAIPTYQTGKGKVLGRIVSVNVTINNAEGELYADDMLAEYAAEFSSADLTAEVDNISLENQALLYGASYATSGDNAGEMTAGPEDTPPYGGVGGYQSLQVNGSKKYRAWFYPKAKASMPDFDGTTKGSSISFGTEPIKMKISAPKYGPWYYVREFTSETAAKTYINGKLGIT